MCSLVNWRMVFVVECYRFVLKFDKKRESIYEKIILRRDVFKENKCYYDNFFMFLLSYK